MASKTPETAPPKIGLHEAVDAARAFLTDLYSTSRIENVLLEEVEEQRTEWLITFGFDTPRSVRESVPGLLLSFPKREEMTRVFKTFIVDSESGKVRAMKIHPNAVTA
jgi:hypothetical protein